MTEEPTPAKPTTRQRLAALLLAARIFAQAHPRELAVAAAALCFVLLIAFWPAPETAPQAEPTATTQPVTPLAPLVARLDALEADVIDLQDRAADLEGLQPPQPTAPRRRAAASTPASSPQATQPQQPQAPQPKAWGATDLDRAIDVFTPPTTFGVKP
jgi:hypothetical protein